MTVLVLGIGMQGRAVVEDLDQFAQVEQVVAADLDANTVQATLAAWPLSKARAWCVDASDVHDVRRAIRRFKARMVVCMVPPVLQNAVAEAAIAEGVPMVSASYTRNLGALDGEARQRGVALLPEMGLDPGIDLVLCRLAVEALDEVHGLWSYGGGVPEAAAADNTLKYKVTWTLDGVLAAYRRPARLLRDGQEVSIPELGIFEPEHVHTIQVDDAGMMEAYPNGDALGYIPLFDLGEPLRHMARFTLRWPGHCALWRMLAGLGLLSEQPLVMGGLPISPLAFLARHLEPRLQFQAHERDLVVLRAKAWGIRAGQPKEICWDLLDWRDGRTGLYAMNRTVGYAAAIGARLILDGTIPDVGLLSPVRHVPPQPFIQALQQRGMVVRCLER